MTRSALFEISPYISRSQTDDSAAQNEVFYVLQLILSEPVPFFWKQVMISQGKNCSNDKNYYH